MPSQHELDTCYMKVALAHSELSKANRKKVGACLVTPSGVIIPGYNGTPAGWDNVCEYNNVTSPYVIHAELNCILKASKEGISIKGSNIYVTLSPCQQCSAMIAQAGISEVIYLEEYRDKTGIYELMKNNIKVRKFIV